MSDDESPPPTETAARDASPSYIGLVIENLSQRIASPPRYQPLVQVAAAWMAGIAFDRAFAPRGPEVWFLLAGMAWCAWLIAHRLRRPVLGTCLLLLCVLTVGAARHHLAWRLYPADELSRWATLEDRPIYLEAEVLRAPKIHAPRGFDPLVNAKGDPKAKNVRSRFPIRVQAIREGLLWRSADGNAICAIESDQSHLRPGDRIRVAGFLQRLPTALNPGEFDFALHARADRQLCQIRSDIPGGVTVIDPASPWSPATWLPRLRTFGVGLLRENLTDEEAPLASAVLLGTREQLPYEQTEEFILTGTIHILSISGLHVGILAYVLFQAMRLGWIGRGKALALTVALITVYVVMTDAEPPAMRAMFMVWIVCGSIVLGRPGAAFNSLACAALLVTIVNPNDLFRTGPQLSFLSMCVLCWVASLRGVTGQADDPLLRLLMRDPGFSPGLFGRCMLRVAAVVGVGTLIWAVTLPLVVARFSVVSWSALLLNPVLSPVMTGAMIFGFGVLATGWWLPPVARLCGLCCDWCLSWLHFVIHHTAEIPGSYAWFSGPADWWLIGFYVGLGVWAAFCAWLPDWKVCAPLLVLYCVLGWGESIYRQSLEPGPRCTFAAVGHGGAAVIECPDGRVIVFDCGRMGSPILGERAIEAVLRSRGIRRIDTIVISHADTDHYNALPELLKRFPVSQIMLAPRMYDEMLEIESTLAASEGDGSPSTALNAHNAALAVCLKRTAQASRRDQHDGDRRGVGQRFEFSPPHPAPADRRRAGER
ncbi:MAG: ComEC/Rec2 family competence protein [Pirellulales bacterium]